MTGPFATCKRTTCATDRLHDGPDINLRALPAATRRPAFDLLHPACDGWHRTAVHEMVADIHRLAYHVAGPRQGSRQAYWFATLADHMDAELLMRASGLEAVGNIQKGHTEVWSTTVRTHMPRAHRQPRRARTATTVLTVADCQRVGHGEHPATDTAGREQADA